MSSRNPDQEYSRRDLLRAGIAVATLGLGRPAAAKAMEPREALKPVVDQFRVGLQSYSLRGFTSDGKPDLKKALSVTRDLGIRFWEAYPAHIPVTLDRSALRMVQDQLEAHQVRVIGFGVVHLGMDEAENRRIFTFARELGIGYLSADPDPGAFDLLDRLVEEYGLPVGIHNHGPGHRYDTIDRIAAAIRDHHPKIGCCIDTGHFLRSREDPVRAAEVFGTRVYGVHLKDVKNAETFTVLGQGDLRTTDFLKTLAAHRYDHCLAIEYEENPEDPRAEIQECLQELKRAAAPLTVD